MMYFASVVVVTHLILRNFLPVSANFLSMGYNANVNAMKKAQGNIRGITTGQYPSYMPITSLRIIRLKPGDGSVRDIRNLLSFTGLISKQKPITFVTEQNGYGNIIASFNSRRLECKGVPGARFKQCTITASLRPWSGRFVVQAYSGGRKISAAFRMAANAVCPNRGMKGDDCNQDVNECVKFKDRRICSWKDGCVNTIGSYRCQCPQGYAVSKKDFRICDPILPKITTASKVLTVLYQDSVELPCQYSGPALRKRLWIKESNILVSETKEGVLLPNIKPQRFSLSNDGTLKISSLKFADQGIYTCQVQTIAGITTRRAHLVKIETIPLIGIKFFSNNKYSVTKEYKVDDTIIIECQALAIPRGTITWRDASGKDIIQSHKYKFQSDQLKNYQLGAIYNRLQINNASMSDNGQLTCFGQNKRGSASKSVTVIVK